MSMYDPAYMAKDVIELCGVTTVGTHARFRKCTNCDERLTPGSAICNAYVKFSDKVRYTCFCISCAKRLLPAYRKVLQEKLNTLPAIEVQLTYGGEK